MLAVVITDDEASVDALASQLANVKVSPTVISPFQPHVSLGHINYAALLRLARDNLELIVLKNTFQAPCEACLVAKFTR
jgi:hypothetical protein